MLFEHGQAGFEGGFVVQVVEIVPFSLLFSEFVVGWQLMRVFGRC